MARQWLDTTDVRTPTRLFDLTSDQTVVPNPGVVFADEEGQARVDLDGGFAVNNRAYGPAQWVILEVSQERGLVVTLARNAQLPRRNPEQYSPTRCPRADRVVRGNLERGLGGL
jgi:hypothetical protein